MNVEDSGNGEFIDSPRAALGRRLNGNNINDEKQAASEFVASVFKAVDEEYASHLSKVPPDALWRGHLNPILREVGVELAKLCDAARERAINRLFELLGELVEGRFIRARTATIFLAIGDDTLKSVATANLHRENLQILFSDHGIVPWVARNKVWRCVDDVEKEPDYFGDIDETRSELAVPLIIPGGTLIGVVNLESDRLAHFSEKSVKRVLRVSGEIITHLLVLWELETGLEGRLPWHPEINGWDLQDLLTRVCHAIARSLDRDTSQAIIAYVDSQKDSVNIYATSGAGAAFKAHRQLRLSSSDFGSAFREAYPSNVVTYNPQDDLAPRTGNLLEVNEGWLVTIDLNNADCRRNHSSAALVVFFTGGDDQGELLTGSRNLIVREALPELARITRMWTRTFGAIRPLIAKAKLLSRIEPITERHHKFEALLESALNLLPAAAGSIFVVRPGTTKLDCVATTGLTRPDFDRTPIDELAYDLVRDTRHKTVIAAHRQGKPIRWNRVRGYSSHRRKGSDASYCPKFIEVLPTESRVHRRLLMIAIVSDDKILGVIRMARTLDQSPFTHCDGHLLWHLAQHGVEIVEEFWTKLGKVDATLQAGGKRFRLEAAQTPVADRRTND